MGLLDDKTAIVTGGGGGIGRGIAERFASEGAAVVVAEVDQGRAEDTVAAIRAADGIAVGVVADVREPGDVERVLRAALDEQGRVDVLVNNVGHYGGARKAFHESTPADWLDLYCVNLEHVLLCSRAVLGPMVEQGSGTIVNVSTIEAFRGIPTRAVYAAF